MGHEILKNISYCRGRTSPDFKTSYKGVDVIEVNTTRNIPSRRLNQNTPQGKEFESLIKKLFNKTNKIIEETLKETNKSEQTIRNTVNNNEYPMYVTFAEKQIRNIVEEKNPSIKLVLQWTDQEVK